MRKPVFEDSDKVGQNQSVTVQGLEAGSFG